MSSAKLSQTLCFSAQDTMEFAHHHDIVPKLVVFEGIDKAPEAYAAMMKGEYRVVLKIADE